MARKGGGSFRSPLCRPVFAEGLIRVRSFAASSAHKGLWLAEDMSPDTLNHALTMWDVDGDLDAAVMESAFLHVMDEAEVLRVTFADDGDGLRLTPRELGDWRPFFLDVSTADDPERAAREALADIVRRPFDLGRDLLMRLGVVRLAANRSLVVLAYHHLVSDGFGTGGLLSRRLAEVYTALARRERVPRPEHAWDTESFTAEAAAYLSSRQFTDDTGFWRDYLKDAPAPAQLPRVALSEARRTELDEPTGPADRWGRLSEPIGMVSRTLSVPHAEAQTWTRAAQSMGVWMSSMLTAAAAVYFRHRCDRPEFLLSLAVGNRVGVASRTPGLAVNVVPVRVSVPLAATFSEVADALGDQTYDIFDHLACHYSEIQRASGTALGDRGSFGAVLNVVDFVEQLHFAGSPARYLGGTTGAFDELSIAVYRDGTADSDLHLRLDAPATLYSRAELRFIGEELIAYIRALVAAGARPVGALDVVGAAERDRLLSTAPDDTAGQPRPTEPTVPELFARQVRRAPDAVALADGETTLSYRELDERAGRVAGALRRRGIGPEAVLAVALPRSAELAVALLGIARAGAAALPVDPAADPAGQLGPALAGTPVHALLTGAPPGEALTAGPDVPVFRLGELLAETASELPDAPPHPDALLAVAYGSAPDGVATGISVTHRAVLRLALDRDCRRAGAGPVLWHTPPTSEALAFELWVPLLNGGRVVVAPSGELDADRLPDLCAAYGGATVWLPAQLCAAVAAHRPERLAGLREVWTGGDRVPAAALRRIREACPQVTVVHAYGPAQPPGFAAAHRLTGGAAADPGDAVGRPADDSALYVLGPGLAPVPAGVTGELYVAGPGLARGCTGRPAQTARHFVPCPFGPPGARMYRTGDRARWEADGRLGYVGRAGSQVDVRGIRVELTGIEEVLSEHPAVARAVVVAGRDDAGQQRLVAHVVPAGGGTVAEEELRRFAAARLPKTVVPAVFTMPERLPVTPGGRTDLAALPDPQCDDATYRAPRNDTERVLAAAFAEVLEVERVGIDEDFFDLGGNSLRAIRLVGLVRAELRQELSIRRLFAARTVAGLSEMWQDLAKSSRPALRRRTKEGAVL
ncbi:AMP-binding protein [Streptomyces sp. NPDC006552]|uniref:AMP-binding protein n=1 Tax=Streptomyces sp. NPDC006552 TaxID=3157179 RepID=UPI0033BF6221